MVGGTYLHASLASQPGAADRSAVAAAGRSMLSSSRRLRRFMTPSTALRAQSLSAQMNGCVGEASTAPKHQTVHLLPVPLKINRFVKISKVDHESNRGQHLKAECAPPLPVERGTNSGRADLLDPLLSLLQRIRISICRKRVRLWI